MRRLCYLQNAYEVSYRKHPTKLWTGGFTLPVGDSKAEFCESMNFVELWDLNEDGSDKYIGLFRIMPTEKILYAETSTIRYSVEHVLATLLDDTLLGWHEIGNLGVFTADVLRYILDRQTIPRWALGEVDYRHQFLYGWQDENLLAALYSVTNPFKDSDYSWQFDTTRIPWTLNLVRGDPEPVAAIRYRKNLNGIVRTEDPTQLTTVLYCYGFGEADNKLNIERVLVDADGNVDDTVDEDDNPNGRPYGLSYLESPNISEYGRITRVWTDERYTNANSLYEAGQALLAKLERPIVSYELDIATVREAANLEPGDMVRINADGNEIFTRVLTVEKEDVSGNPMLGTITLVNDGRDVSRSMADLVDRQRIAATYAQGAESLFADSMADNADPDSPAEISFVIPEHAVHVNEIILNVAFSQFRAYSKAIGGGGDVTSKPSSETSSGSSSETSSGPSTLTTTAQDNTTTTTSQDFTLSGGSGALRTPEVLMTTPSGGTTTTTQTNNTTTTSKVVTLDIGIMTFGPVSYIDDIRTHTEGNHNHGINHGAEVATTLRVIRDAATGFLTGISYLPAYYSASGGFTHAHSSYGHGHQVRVDGHNHDLEHQHTVPNHQHNINHTHTIDSHTHNMAHTHKYPHTHDIDHRHSIVHTHNIDHTHDLPSHVHGIEYGIYKGPRASRGRIYIDDPNVEGGFRLVPIRVIRDGKEEEQEYFEYSVSNLNLLMNMAKNSNGEVMRGKRTVRIVPDLLTRIEMQVQIRLFTARRGDGQH